MLAFTIALFLASPFLTLRLDGGGSFEKPLSADEEKYWLERLEYGDPEARDVLVVRNLRLVAHIAKKYYSNETDKEDLMQCGTIGLINAVMSFRRDKQTQLSTYASTCIENEMRMYFRKRRKYSGEASIDEPLDTDRDGNPLTLKDILYTTGDLGEELESNEVHGRLDAFITEELSELEKNIIRARYYSDGRSVVPQREVAVKNGISRSYVSRIEKKALEKLRLRFEKDGF
ncbi:MAG: sigma-70 family RNA polymerase sigma factor [Oscillospiraceae bacterium]|jgi:RNA polymerase sporulation-specific sigma factor|nr:sigma-70 family RNA polymerase sigma factor [Oscillospiraceae bacterium]